MYCTRDDLIAKFGERELVTLTAERGEDAINETRLTDAISSVNEVIDAHIAMRYPLPLPTVPGVLKRIAINIVRADIDQRPAERVTEDKKSAMQLLTKISKGELSLGLEASEPEPQALDLAEMQSFESVFSRDKTGGWI
ncbi:hypothetical protein N473_06910 [Pseudoalteromonas luteoviolacea CPMOR-1]|uniref:Mu-like prophage FluMu protein gp36 n=1 Tax=Pseudoalteromonas luteoviolacea CPMOR-1 TaxID=1365248 RepID=A0A167H3W0_9GAMM|nr:DUF1320 domain-containing protein [Pseudoalteromonas luteoviolacea]KZN57603.1 hypothetical protein N473_06910 [Pseudoalteromonas luteoviolacea CPMOR-1]